MTPESSGVARRTVSGAAWLVGSRLATKIVDFITLLILARLLAPHDFGVVAMALPIIQIMEAILELPVAQVLVTRTTIDRAHLDTAFTLGTIRGLLLGVVTLALSFPLSQAYNDQHLLVILPILGMAPAFRGINSPQLAVFARRLEYRQVFIVELAGKLGAFLFSCSAAFIFHDFWALVIGTVANPAIGTITSYVIAPYLPRLSLAAWPSFSNFLRWTTGTQALSALNWQADRLILARYVSNSQLGEFSLANDLSYLPEQALIKPIVAPLMSAFVSVRHDPGRLAAAYTKSAVTVLAVGMPVMLLLSLLSDPLVHFGLGGKWIAAVPYLQWLSLTLIPALFVAPMPALAMALNRPEITLHQLLIETLCKIPMITAGAILYGTNGVIIARAASSCISALASMYFVWRLTKVNLIDQLKPSRRVFAAGMCLAIIVVLLRPLFNEKYPLTLAFLLPAITGAGLITYCLSLLLLWYFAGCPEGIESRVIKLIIKIFKLRQYRL